MSRSLAAIGLASVALLTPARVSAQTGHGQGPGSDLIRQGVQLDQNGQYAEARRLFKQAIDLNATPQAKAPGIRATMGQLTERPLAGALAHPAIGYCTRPTHDLVAALNRRLEEGDARITFDEGSGYLRSVLDALHVPAESQMLVMSKTGVQGLYTGPANPRAIFFNDAVTVGYIRGAPLLELAVHDSEQGVLFYTLDQKPQPRPAFERRPACLSCYQVYSTLHVPGFVARSVFMAPDGLPLSQFGSYDTDDRTPFRRRWGGWYVTGTHGSMRHIGNAVAGRMGSEKGRSVTLATR